MIKHGLIASCFLFLFGCSNNEQIFEPNSSEPSCSTNPNCNICTADEKTCHNCNDPYFAENGVCKKCSENCAECGSAQVCSKCKNGYGRNEQDRCEQCVSNCLECDGSPGTSCTTCGAGYYIDGTEGNYTCKLCKKDDMSKTACQKSESA